MTPDSLRNELHARNWSGPTLAVWLGVHPRTVARWLLGSHPIPVYVGWLLTTPPQRPRKVDAPVDAPTATRVEDGA